VARLGIGYVPEGQGIFATLTVDENLRVAMRDEAAGRRRLPDVLALFPDLERLRAARAGTLSGGQKQMLSIARALVNDNQLLLVEQNFAMASALADDYSLIDDGRTVRHGAMAALAADAALKERYLGV
jgi:branched-chain amino acid transport system ATP-binding protein